MRSADIVEKIAKMTGGKEWFKAHQPDVFRIGHEQEDWSHIEERFDDAVELLTSYSLVMVKNSEEVHKTGEKDAEDRWFYMHPLVHTWAFDRLDSKTKGRSLTVATFMACLAASAPYRNPRDQVEWLFRDLAHNLERLATLFIEQKTRHNESFTKEQSNIVKGLWAALVATLQWGKARRLRRELLGSATRFMFTRAKSGTAVTVNYIKKHSSSPSLIAKGFSPSLKSRSSSPSPSLSAKSPPLLSQDVFGDAIPLSTPPIEEETSLELGEIETEQTASRGGSYSSITNRAKLGTAAFMRRASPSLQSKSSSPPDNDNEEKELEQIESGPIVPDQEDQPDGHGGLCIVEAPTPIDSQGSSFEQFETRAARSLARARDESTTLMRRISPHLRSQSTDRESTHEHAETQTQPASSEKSSPVSLPEESPGDKSSPQQGLDEESSPSDEKANVVADETRVAVHTEETPRASTVKLSKMQQALMKRTMQETTALLKKKPSAFSFKKSAKAQDTEAAEKLVAPDTSPKEATGDADDASLEAHRTPEQDSGSKAVEV